MRMEDWGRLDLDTILQWTRDEIKPEKLFLIGHSAGGQLVGLAKHSETLSGMIFVACQSGYWKHFTKIKRRLWLFWNLVIPVLSKGRDYFPARLLGLSTVDLPSGVALQWASWCRSPDYLFDGSHLIDTQRYPKLSMPILAYSFSDDKFAPHRAVEALLAKYPECQITRRRIWPVDVRYPHIGHLGFFKGHMHDTLWRETAEWLKGGSLGARRCSPRATRRPPHSQWHSHISKYPLQTLAIPSRCRFVGAGKAVVILLIDEGPALARITRGPRVDLARP